MTRAKFFWGGGEEMNWPPTIGRSKIAHEYACVYIHSHHTTQTDTR